MDDVSIWKHPGYDKRRDAWRKTLLGESETQLTPAVLAYCAKVFNDTIQTFLGEMHERIQLRSAQEEEDALAEKKTFRARCSAIAKSGLQCKLPAMEGKSTCINHSAAAADDFSDGAAEEQKEEEKVDVNPDDMDVDEADDERVPAQQQQQTSNPEGDQTDTLD